MRVLAVLIPVFAAGVAGFFALTAERGADEQFVAAQRDPPAPLQPVDVEVAVRAAPGPEGDRGRRARCRPGGPAELRNPWSCRVTYPSGAVADYIVRVRSDGSYTGRHVGGTGSITGCCVAPPE